MLDKQKRIEQSSQDLIRDAQELISCSREQIEQVMRRRMDPQELGMYDLALFCEGEMIKAQNAQAHFAACIMGAGMVESILALMCIRYDSEVSATKQFQYSTKKGSRPLRDVVSHWKLEQFITVAEECEWIPADIVEEKFKVALAEGFRELMPVTNPEMTAEEIERGATAFFIYPGTAMLRMTQSLRNAIHPGKWMRSKHPFAAEHFTEWCQLATQLCGEIRLCLLILLTRRTERLFADQIRELTKQLESLPPEFRALWDELVKMELNK